MLPERLYQKEMPPPIVKELIKDCAGIDLAAMKKGMGEIEGEKAKTK